VLVTGARGGLLEGFVASLMQPRNGKALEPVAKN